MTEKTPSPFLALLKLELGADQFTRGTFVLALTFFYLPWLGLNVCMSALGRDLTAFYPGILGMLLLLWMLCACGLASTPQVPLVWSHQPNFKAFEFLLTRAIDRRMNFRAKAAAALIIVLATQLPGLIWSLAQPDMLVTFDVRSQSEDGSVAWAEPDFIEGRAFPTARYVAAFPGSERLPGAKPEDRERLRIRHGWLTYAAWLAWTCTLLMALAFAYYAAVGGRLKQPGWWANTVLLAPLPVVAGAVGFAIWRGFNPGDELFLFFRGHLILCVFLLVGAGHASLRWCERRFSDLEIP